MTSTAYLSSLLISKYSGIDISECFLGFKLLCTSFLVVSYMRYLSLVEITIKSFDLFNGLICLTGVLPI